MEKKGLSEIVSTLIIILLTLVAIGVIWVVVQNVLRSGAEQIEVGQYSLDLEIKSVQIEGEDVTIVVVKRNPGEGEFIGINFIFSNGTDSEIIRKDTTLNELDTKTFTLTLENIKTSTLTSVSVAPIYKTSSGKESQGSVADEFDVLSNKSLGVTWITQTITDTAFEEGYTTELGVNNRIEVQIDSEDHYIGVVLISETEATIEISSNPMEFRLSVGKSARVDVNNNGFYDVYILLNEIVNNKANIRIQKVHEAIPEGGNSIAITGGVVAERNFEKLGYTGMGAATYTNSYGGQVTIKFISETVNPVDVHVGDNQTFTVTVYSQYNITNVTAFTQLDNSDLTLQLMKILDDNNGTSTWSITWTVYDTHVTTYRTIITAIDSVGNSGNDTLTWTDACGFIQGQDKTLVSSCTLGTNEVYGLDNGILYLSTGGSIQVDSGSTFVYAPGYSIVKSVANAYIKDNGGRIAKGYIYYYDGDQDTYPTNSTMIFSVNGALGSPLKRVKDSPQSGGSPSIDCAPSDPNKQYYNDCYVNNDGDGYYSTSTSSVCSSSGCYGYSSSPGTDCNDGNGNVWTYGYGYDGDRDGYGLTCTPGCYYPDNLDIGCYNGGYPYDATLGFDCVDYDAGVPPGDCY